MTTCTYASLIQIRNGIVVSYTAYCIYYTPQTNILRYIRTVIIGLKGTLNQMREPKTVVMGLSRIGTFPCYDYYSILYPEYGRISF